MLDLANIEIALYSFHKMNDTVSNVIQGGLAILAGTAMLLNLEWVANFDQRCGVKVNAWLKKRLGNSFLTRDIWPVGNRSGKRSSRIGCGLAAVFLILCGLGLVAVSLYEQFRVNHLARTIFR